MREKIQKCNVESSKDRRMEQDIKIHRIIGLVLRNVLTDGQTVTPL